MNFLSVPYPQTLMVCHELKYESSWKVQKLLLIILQAYPYFNGRSKRSAQPVSVGGKAQGSDDVVVIQSVQMLSIIQIPQHSLAILQKQLHLQFTRKHMKFHSAAGRTCTIFLIELRLKYFCISTCINLHEHFKYTDLAS